MISIVEVSTKAQRRQFVTYPAMLYRTVSQFIPGTYQDDMEDWDKKKNPAYAYCEARSWLAYRDRKIVGRIGAIYSRASNEKWGTNRLRFTQVDFENDPEISDALFATVEKWARELGCREVHGPLGFSDLDREGMLVEGFDRRSCFFTYYNFPYYAEHLARLGYTKDVDWVEKLITVPEDPGVLAHWEKLSQFVQKRCHVHEHTVKRRREYRHVLRSFFQLVNKSYAPLYGTVPLSDAQIQRYAGKFAPLVNPHLACFVMDENEQMIAMGVAALSIAEALRKSHGKLFPFGWIRLLRAFRKNDTIDLLLIAVDPAYQNRGVNAIVMNRLMQGCHEMGIKYAETGPMLEDNDKVQSQWKSFDTTPHKRRRCFIKRLE